MPMRSLEGAIVRLYHFLRDDGHEIVVDLVDEFWNVDRVVLLAELRLVALDAGLPLAVVAEFDR